MHDNIQTTLYSHLNSLIVIRKHFDKIRYTIEGVSKIPILQEKNLSTLQEISLPWEKWNLAVYLNIIFLLFYFTVRSIQSEKKFSLV